MKKRKIRIAGNLACILAAVLVIMALVRDVDAEESYPNRKSIAQHWGSFTKYVEWNDKSHSRDNYSAVLTLSASNLDFKKFQPVDVVVLMSNSAHMFSPSCSNPVHQTLEIDSSARITEGLDELWSNGSYENIVPDITGLSSAAMKEMSAGDFVKSMNLAGKNGYLMPLLIYTQESGGNYVESFKHRDNWRFVTLGDNSADGSNNLHLGKNGKVISKIRKSGSISGAYELTVTGKAGMDARCNSGSAIAADSAQTFVRTLFKNSPESRVALVPYADGLNSGDVSFSSDEEMLLKQIEAVYEASGGNVNTKEALEAAIKVLGGDADGRKKAVVFLSDASIEYDASREDAVKIAAGFRDQGIETYVMGYQVEDMASINKWIKPFAFDYNEELPEKCKYYIDTNKSNYGLKDGYKKIAEKLTVNYLIFTDYISEYFEVDKENVRSGVIVEDITISEMDTEKTVQRVTVKVPAVKIKSKSAEVKLPIKLKEEFKSSQEFLNTNYTFQDSDSLKGAGVEFMGSDGTIRSLKADSVYLQPDSSGAPPEITEAWLHFDLRGGSPPDGNSFESVLMNVGEKISEAPGYQVVPVKKGYQFDGWYLERAYSNEVGDGTMPAKDIIIYAKWTEEEPAETEVKLTYNLWGGEAPSEKVFQSEILQCGAKISSAKDYHKTPKKKDSRFEGWYLDMSGQNPVEDTDVLNEDTVIHAKWTVVKAKLIYMTQGGGLSDGSKLEPDLVGIGTYIEDAPGYRASLVKDGFVFGGWYMDADYNIPVGMHNMPEETTLIYAKWER